MSYPIYTPTIGNDLTEELDDALEKAIAAMALRFIKDVTDRGHA